MKGDKNAEIGMVWGLGVIGNIAIRYSAYDFLFDFNRNYASIFSSYYPLFPKISRRHLTVITPTQRTVCNPSAKTYNKLVDTI